MGSPSAVVHGPAGGSPCCKVNILFIRNLVHENVRAGVVANKVCLSLEIAFGRYDIFLSYLTINSVSEEELVRTK